MGHPVEVDIIKFTLRIFRCMIMAGPFPRAITWKLTLFLHCHVQL